MRCPSLQPHTFYKQSVHPQMYPSNKATQEKTATIKIFYSSLNRIVQSIIVIFADVMFVVPAIMIQYFSSCSSHGSGRWMIYLIKSKCEYADELRARTGNRCQNQLKKEGLILFIQRGPCTRKDTQTQHLIRVPSHSNKIAARQNVSLYVRARFCN